MTRETKAGLLVSCSFLCLVGVVLYSKWNEKDEVAPGAGTEENRWQPEPDKLQPSAVQGNGGKPNGKEPGILAVAAQTTANTLPTSTTQAPPPSSPADDKLRVKPAEQKLAAGQRQGPDTTKPVATTPEKDKRYAGGAVVAPVLDFSKQPNQASKPNPLVAKTGSNDGKRGQSQLPIQVPPPPPPAAGLTQKSSNNTPAPQKNWWDDISPKKDATKPTHADTKQADSKPNTNGASTAWPSTWDQPAKTVKNNAAEQPQINFDSTKPSPKASTPDKSAPALPDTIGGASVVSRPAPQPASSAPTSNNNATPRSTQPIAAPVSAATIPIRVSPPANAPQSLAALQPEVDAYDEETYSVRPNDSFQSIALDKYQSDRYSRALWLFNRDHPLATASVKSDPPILQVGQEVYIPPTRILDRYYAAAISQSVTPVATNFANAAVSETTTTPAAPALPPEPPNSYRVASGGEMIRDIARRTLGDGDRWVEIYRLNPTVDPKELVPANTELRLPTGTR
jgi:hypothetical protein